MKSKGIVKIIVFNAVIGGNVPLAIVVKSKEPRCFYLCGNVFPRMAYTNQ